MPEPLCGVGRPKEEIKGVKYPISCAWSTEWDLGHGFKVVLEEGEQLQRQSWCLQHGWDLPWEEPSSSYLQPALAEISSSTYPGKERELWGAQREWWKPAWQKWDLFFPPKVVIETLFKQTNSILNLYQKKCKLGNALEDLSGIFFWSSLWVTQRDQMLYLHVITYCQCPERYFCSELSCQEVWRRISFQMVQDFVISSYRSAQKMSTESLLWGPGWGIFYKNRLPDA